MDFGPPAPLSIAARRVWDRNAARIHSEGRWKYIDQELLAVFCQTLELYERCKADVDEHGVSVRGRTERELVRNTALTHGLRGIPKITGCVQQGGVRAGADFQAQRVVAE
jgi:phage terminase small subunit